MVGMLGALGVPQILRAQDVVLPVRGANLVEMRDAPFSSAKAAESLCRLADTGASWVAIIPFFWQPGPSDPRLVAGDALPPARLREGIRQAKATGLKVLVKPHVWVPQTWAGAISMRSEADWRRWFAAYEQALLPIADAAQEEGADALSIGTELRETSSRAQWSSLIGRVRQHYAGLLTYVAQGSGESSQVPFWPLLDVVSTSLYPELGGAGDKPAWHRAMAGELARLRALSLGAGKPLWLAEIGIRSARNASLQPWQSAEERVAEVDLQLQADVISAWLAEAAAHDAQGVFVWRWFSDPAAGGGSDTDFTIQNKPAEEVLRTAWSGI